MLSEEFIIFEKKAKNRKDVLKRACQLLINKGIVQSEFARDVLEREKVEATAVGCNIAIPHGKPEHVNRCQILVIRLDKPIEWGERMADMIFLLAINFDSVNTTKAFFHDFTKLLNENGATDRLREAAVQLSGKSWGGTEYHINTKLHQRWCNFAFWGILKKLIPHSTIKP